MYFGSSGVATPGLRAMVIIAKALSSPCQFKALLAVVVTVKSPSHYGSLAMPLFGSPLIDAK